MNKNEKLQDAIGLIGDDLIADAKNCGAREKTHDSVSKNKVVFNSKLRWGAVAAILVVAITAGIMLSRGDGENMMLDDGETTKDNSLMADDNEDSNHKNDGNQSNHKPVIDVVLDNEILDAHVVSKVEYPVMAPYPQDAISSGNYEDASIKEWNKSQAKQVLQYRELGINIDDFIADSTKVFLTNSNGKNLLYSPVNVYMALCLLAESTNGNSRQQILEVLGVKDIDALREEANAIWNANYCNDGAVTSVLANSIWLNKGINFKQDTMETIAKNYYASSYVGQMGSDDFNTALHTWLNENTGGLLKNQVEGINFDSDDIMALASTLYYSARWETKFEPIATSKKIFHGTSGDVEIEFMNESNTGMYYWGDKFSAINRQMKESGNMYFILPDEDVSIDELIEDSEMMDFISKGYKWSNRKYLTVNVSIPKFDVESQIDLRSGLNKLGITDVFDSSISDFSSMINDDVDMSVSEALHGVRVKIDEEGCEAAAYTIMITDGAAMPEEEEIDFVLDRPFIFVITSKVGQPLFIGVVNQL